MLYIIYAESANYCGYGQHFVTDAISAKDAEVKVEAAIEEYFYEQDNDQILDEHGEDFDGCYGTVVTVEEFGPEHESWGFYQDSSQAEFYTKV